MNCVGCARMSIPAYCLWPKSGGVEALLPAVLTGLEDIGMLFPSVSGGGRHFFWEFGLCSTSLVPQTA